MTFRSVALLLVVLLAGLGCKKEENEENTVTTPNTPARVVKSSYTVDGETHNTSDIEVQHSTLSDTLLITSNFSGSTTALLMFPILGEGSHTDFSEAVWVFQISIDTQFWACSECVATVHEHDAEDKWYDVSISGELAGFLGAPDLTLDDARISVFY